MHFVIISIYYLQLVGFLFRMVAPSSKRSIIIILYQAGNQTKDIVKLMKISRTMVQKTVKRFKEIGSAADRPGRGRKRSARAEQNKTSFVRWFDEIPEDPYEKWAKNWKSTKNRSESSSGRAWDSTPTESKKVHELTDKMISIRRKRYQQFPKWLSSARYKTIIFSDE